MDVPSYFGPSSAINLECLYNQDVWRRVDVIVDFCIRIAYHISIPICGQIHRPTGAILAAVAGIVPYMKMAAAMKASVQKPKSRCVAALLPFLTPVGMTKPLHLRPKKMPASLNGIVILCLRAFLVNALLVFPTVNCVMT